MPTFGTTADDEVVSLHEQFYIQATSSRADDRTRVLKHDETFAVFDRFGDVQPVGLGEQGVYHDGTRFLSRLELRLGGRRPLLLSSTVKKENDLLTVDLTNARPQGRDGAARAAARDAARVPHQVPVAEHLLRAAARLQLRDARRSTSSWRCSFDADLRRHLRGARHEARAARHPPRAGGRTRRA